MLRGRAEPAGADRDPRVAAVEQVLAEQPNRDLVGAQRRDVQPRRSDREILDPLLQMLRPPLPRPHPSVLQQTADQPLPGADRLLGQKPRALLANPPGQDRVEQRLLKMQRRTPSPNRRASSPSTSTPPGSIGAGDHERAGVNRNHLASDAISQTRGARSPQSAELPSASWADRDMPLASAGARGWEPLAWPHLSGSGCRFGLFGGRSRGCFLCKAGARRCNAGLGQRSGMSPRGRSCFRPNAGVAAAQTHALTAGSTVVAASSTCRGSSPSGQRYTRSQPASA